jgi:hypothetical protein
LLEPPEPSDESDDFEELDDLESDPDLESDDFDSDDLEFFDPLEGVEEVLLSFRYQPEPLK